MKIAVLIVNWNGGPLLSRCLQSLGTQRRAPDRVVVVDNASTDESLALAGPWLQTAHVIRLDENTGFARGSRLFTCVTSPHAPCRNTTGSAA